MRESQFYAWLLFLAPILACFGNSTLLFQQQVLIALVYSIFPIVLFFVAEREFIKDCKKGYCTFEDSILPQFLYRGYNGDVE